MKKPTRIREPLLETCPKVHTEVGIVQHGGNADQTSSATGNDGDILPCVLALLTLTMVCVVQIGDGNPQGFDTRSRPILTTGHGDFNGLWAVKATFDVIVDLYRNRLL
jgi:hypothetical protein